MCKTLVIDESDSSKDLYTLYTLKKNEKKKSSLGLCSFHLQFIVGVLMTARPDGTFFFI